MEQPYMYRPNIWINFAYIIIIKFYFKKSRSTDQLPGSEVASTARGAGVAGDDVRQFEDQGEDYEIVLSYYL
jgi:hypothetical protein